MPDSGVLIIGDQIIGYSERYIYLCWEAPSDISSIRNVFLENPYLGTYSIRWAYGNHIKYMYCDRWGTINYTPIPVSDRFVYLKYCLTSRSERTSYYELDTGFRYCFYESLLTQTPLLMKYTKYTTWEYVPQILNPEFKIWSHYDLDEDNISLHIISDNNVDIFLNSGVNKSKFKIVRNTVNPKYYDITCYVDHVFDNDETINCYLTLFDIKGNYLKDGLW